MAYVLECSNAEYHARHDLVGASMLKTFLESPAPYYKMFVGKGPEGFPLLVKPPTENMILGSLVHCLVLEPQKQDELFACRPPGIDGRSTAGREKLGAWRAASLGKLEIDADMLAKARRMSAAVLAEKQVRDFMEGAIIERAVVGEDERTGIPIKCKPDIFTEQPNEEFNLHLDLKTSDDPSPSNWLSPSSFSPVQKFRYDLQVSSHYPAILGQLYDKPCAAGCIVVGSAEPHDVYIYNLTARWEVGEAWRRRALDDLVRCRETNIWRDPEQDAVIQLPPAPVWAFPN